jgi:hypothetical protein
LNAFPEIPQGSHRWARARTGRSFLLDRHRNLAERGNQKRTSIHVEHVLSTDDRDEHAADSGAQQLTDRHRALIERIDLRQLVGRDQLRLHRLHGANERH